MAHYCKREQHVFAAAVNSKYRRRTCWKEIGFRPRCLAGCLHLATVESIPARSAKMQKVSVGCAFSRRTRRPGTRCFGLPAEVFLATRLKRRVVSDEHPGG